MKKYIVLMLALVVLVAFVGCESSSLDDTIETTHSTEVLQNTETTQTTQITETTQATETTQSVAELAAETKRNRANTINYLQVLNAVKNDRNIYKVRYPECYYAFDKDAMICKKIDLSKEIDPKDVSDEDFEYIIDYIESIPSTDGADFWGTESFIIRISYYDDEGNLQNKHINGYNQLPDGWADFICCVNNLCGEDYLSCEGEVIGVTPQLLTEIFCIEDEDLISGTLEELIATNQLVMDDITSEDFDMATQIDLYYDPMIQQYLSDKFITVDSTQKEYDAFVEAFLNSLGEDWMEGSGGDGQLRYLSNLDYGELFIGRSADLPNMWIKEPREHYDEKYYFIQMYQGEFIIEYLFFYSKDGKFILIDRSGYYEENRDIYMKFIELEY